MLGCQTEGSSSGIIIFIAIYTNEGGWIRHGIFSFSYPTRPTYVIKLGPSFLWLKKIHSWVVTLWIKVASISPKKRWQASGPVIGMFRWFYLSWFSNEEEGEFGLRIPPTMRVSSNWIWNHNLVDYATWTFWNKRRTKCSTLIDGDLCLTHAALETWKYGGLDMPSEIKNKLSYMFG